MLRFDAGIVCWVGLPARFLNDDDRPRLRDASETASWARAPRLGTSIDAAAIHVKYPGAITPIKGEGLNLLAHLVGHGHRRNAAEGMGRLNAGAAMMALLNQGHRP